MLLHVVDISHEKYEDQIDVVNKTLQELKAFDKPVVTIFNKMDLYREKYFDQWISDEVKQDIERDLKEKWINLVEMFRKYSKEMKREGTQLFHS